MNEQTPNNAPARNMLSSTCISITGIVRDFQTSTGKEGKVYHDLYLITAANPDLKVSLNSAPESSRFQIGSLAKVNVRLRTWNKDGRSGVMLLEVPA